MPAGSPDDLPLWRTQDCIRVIRFLDCDDTSINSTYQIMIFDFYFWIICTDWDSSTSPYLSFLKVASLVFSSLTAKEQLHQWIQHNLTLGKRIRTLHFPNLHISLTLGIDAEVKNPQISAMSSASTAWYLNISCKVGCIFAMVNWSEFRMRQYRDDDHQEDASHFIISTGRFETEWPQNQMIIKWKAYKFLCMNVLI